MLHHQFLIIYVVILWKIWTILHIDLQDTRIYFWVHNYLGKGVRKVIPSCAAWKIRKEYKADNDVYVPFMEAKEDEERRLNTDD